MLTLLTRIFLAAALFLPGGVAAHHAPGPMRVVAILSLSGPGAPLGVPQLRALEMEVEKINAAGGVLTHQLALAHEDDGGDARRAGEIAQRLARPETADFIIGGSVSATSLAIAGVAQKARIPFFALGASSRITEPLRAWVFKTPPSERMSVLRVLEHLHTTGAKRLAVLVDDTEFGTSVLREVRDHTHRASLGFRKYGVLLEESAVFSVTGGPSVAAAVGRAASASVDAVLIGAYGTVAVEATRAYRARDAKKPLYHTHGAASPEFVRLAGDAGEGVRITVPPLMVANLLPETDPQREVVQRFAREYQKRWGEPASPFAGYAHDALLIALQGIRATRSLDFDQMRRAIEMTRGHVGVTGTYSFWSADHLGLDHSSLRLVEVRGGALHLLP